MARRQPKIRTLTPEVAARVLWVTYGERASDEAVRRMLAARNAGDEDGDRGWQFVAKLIDLEHPGPKRAARPPQDEQGE